MRIFATTASTDKHKATSATRQNLFSIEIGMMQQHSLLAGMLGMILHSSLTTSYPDRSLQQHQGNSEMFRPNVFVELTFESSFIDDCEAFLLSNTNLEDAVISELEYGYFLEYVCMEQGGCVDGFSYDTVNDRLKSLFLNVACPENAAYNETSCLQDYQELGPEYGISADRDRLVDVSNRILWLCTSSFQIIHQEGLFDSRPSLDFGNNTTHSQPYTQGIPSMGPTSPPSLVHTTLSPTQEGTNTTETTVTSKDGVPIQLGLAAKIMLVCVGVVIIFCLAAVVAGRTKHPNYDINKPHDLSVTWNKDISSHWEGSGTDEEGQS